MKSPIISYLLPGLFIGALGGYFFAGTLPQKTRQPKHGTPREAFLSDTADTVDYDRLAQVCLSAAARQPGVAGGSTVAAAHRDSGDPAHLQKTKEYLDRLMSNALEKGSWNRIISFRVQQLMAELPPSDAAEFARLVGTAVERGDLDVVPGAWVPEGLNNKN